MHTKKDQYILIAEADDLLAAQLKKGIEAVSGLPCVVAVTSSEAFTLTSRYSDQLPLAVLDTDLTGITESLFYVTAEQSIPTLLLTNNYTEAYSACTLSPTIIDTVIKNSDVVPNTVEVVRRLNQNRNTEVLIVDSSASIRHYLSHILKNYMLNPVTAASGTEALMKMEAHNFSLILIDSHLSDMPGVELTRSIRKNFPSEHTSIIGISGDSDLHISAMFLKSGASDFLNKPIKREELYCRIMQNLKMTELLSHLEQLNTLKNKMLGMAAHDLVTPITGVQGLATILKEGYAGALTMQQKEIADAIVTASGDMLTLVTDILDVSTIESGLLSIKKETIDLSEIATQRITLTGLSAARKSIAIHQNLEPELHIHGDPKRIGQLLDNLLSNAIKFSAPESTIHIRTTKKEQLIQLIVKDEGPGIAECDLEHLFSPFSKGTATPTGCESSHGLGLHIVKRIASAHNCSVDVASSLGSGTQFTISFPLEAISD
ncbi:hybrid sensor histidine kinase/response regulator [Halodesulfovibrio sp.]|jgi:signal transduction histidine kinase|uniref:hybrid sensor histidine kinase/response regulator n=1 Tax=Halodesulfovibrio sp. TaxID=1912772 RepID=UPI0025FDBD2C|nr:hybrid sensor histidine kinase/response regulator [Halodesulfovibrio sp.]MCT4626176.1 hybrid sensor histidine kinase/response regulator [Halodesulfovibrio sp.]